MQYNSSLLSTYLKVCKNSAFGRCVFIPIVLYLGSSQVKKEIAPGIKRFLFVFTECNDWKRRSIMTLGPLEYLVVGFEGNRFTGQILAELRAASEKGIIRVVDLCVIKKDDQGNVTALELSEL